MVELVQLSSVIVQYFCQFNDSVVHEVGYAFDVEVNILNQHQVFCNIFDHFIYADPWWLWGRSFQVLQIR